MFKLSFVDQSGKLFFAPAFGVVPVG